MKVSTSFDGQTFDARQDAVRLSAQFVTVFKLMSDGKARSLEEIREATGFPTPSISARIRDFRKPKFGGHDVETVRVKKGLYTYRLLVR